MKKTVLYIIITLLLSPLTPKIYAQSLHEEWEYGTGSRVLAGPVISEGILYVGDEDGVFYAIKATSGEVIWSFETEGNIQAKATFVGEDIFFESANQFYLLNSKTGEQKWMFDAEMNPFSYQSNEGEVHYKIDPWDDKRSEAVYYKGIIYIGSGDGNVYGLHAETGENIFKISSINNSPVRSSPLVYDDNLYFGDWDGRVYKYSLSESDFVWIKKTYRGAKPYPSFGGIVTTFTVYNDMLFFGARNHMLNVLFDKTGEKEWTYADPRGGWLIGDPVIVNDTVYIGGSDNFTMYAFSTRDGRLLWSRNSGKNIYSPGLIIDSYLIHTGGNGYDVNDTGKLVLLNRKDGTLIDEVEIPKGVFSAPVYNNGNIFFGSYDGNIYSYKISE